MEIKSINVAVAEKIAAVGSKTAIDIVVESLVKTEVNRRADALEKGLKLHEDTYRELRKVKPDQITYNLDGTKQSETYSKEAVENNKKLTEKLAKIEKAVVKATDENDWSDLYNLVKGSGNAEKKDDAATNK